MALTGCEALRFASKIEPPGATIDANEMQ